MSSYGALAEPYDALTEDVPYEEFADWYETALTPKGGAVLTLLDLGCGTGTLSLLMAHRGYEMICTDASADMLSVFQQKLWETELSVARPMLLCQRSEELDLYGTVDGAYCSLDGMNYLPADCKPEELQAYMHFITALCEMTKNQKRITAKEKTVENEKYAFRCFLLRLGFIGDEYKAERKILLRNLTGSSAFKSTERKEAEADA